MKLVSQVRLLAAAAAIAFSNPALAQDAYPVNPGDYVEVSMISVDDGHDLDYLNYLAGTWRKNQDFAVAQGWISSYEILSNENRRPGEPDLYLVTRFKAFADPAEAKRRDDAYRAFSNTTDEQMQAASADRAKYRHQLGSQLLRAWVWKAK